MKRKNNKIWLIISFFIVFIGCLFISTNATATAAELIFATPGEDASSAINFSWHGESKFSTFYYTTENDSDFTNAIKANVTGVYDDTTFAVYGTANYYFEFGLTELKPSTTYLYKVEMSEVFSSIKSFTTAGKAEDFDFLWYSDCHIYSGGSAERYTRFKVMYDYLTATKEMTFPLVVSTGDDIAYGGDYAGWQLLNTKTGAFTNTVFATTPGNHTYYEYGVSGIVDNHYFNAMLNYPNNGTDDASTSYWFLYNSILFIGLDAIAANSNSYKYLPLQKAWFEDVVKSNTGKYQYIIVYQHYPWMNALTGARSGPYATNYNAWHELFDEYNVDIALSGDYHCYYRSKSIYNDSYTDSSVGTTYIGAPQIGDRYYTISDHIDEDYFAKRIDSPDLTNYSGMTYFHVSTAGITGTLIDTAGVVQDTYTISAKRDVTWESSKKEAVSNISFSSNGITSYVDVNPNYLEYIKGIEVYNGTSLLSSNLVNASIRIDGLESDKLYNLNLKVTFIDDTTLTTTLPASTFSYFGEVYGFRATSANNKIRIEWSSELKNDIVKSYKLYANDQCLDTSSDLSKTYYELDKSKVDSSTVYRLDFLNSSGSVVYSSVTRYSLYGDCNFDGIVNSDDVLAILRNIQNQYNYNDNEIRLLDENNDSLVDIADATTIYKYLNGDVSKLNIEEYVVTVLDKNGNIISSEVVAYGENATIPNIDGTGFLYWSHSFKYITNDVIIRPFYN